MLNCKKGSIVLNALMALLLVIITFFPLAAFGSELLRVSESAENSFLDFSTSLNQTAYGSSGESMSLNLVLDSGTAVVYFDENEPVYFRSLLFSETYSDASIAKHRYFERPLQCEDDLGCLCLFKSVQVKSEFVDEVNVEIYSGTETICQVVDYNLEINSCSIGEATHDNSAGNFKAMYVCEEGFVIDRDFYESEELRTFNKRSREHFILRSLDGLNVFLESTNAYIYEPEEDTKDSYEKVLEEKRVLYVSNEEGTVTSP